MLQTFKAQIALATLLVSGLGALPALAQVRSLAVLHSDLRVAMCAQEWEAALAITNQMINSGEATPEYRQQLVPIKTQLEQYIANDTQFASIPGCGGDGAAADRWQRAVDAVQRGAGSSGSTNSPYTNRYPTGLGGGSYGGSSSGSGNCDYSWQRDSAGRSCGGRAASERPGGR